MARLRHQQCQRFVALAFATTLATDDAECDATSDKRQPLPSRDAYSSSNNLKLWMYRNWMFPYSYLPVPRLLTRQDPLFSSPQFVRGLKLREKDELKMNEILNSNEAKNARQNRDHVQLNELMQKLNDVAYGINVSPQTREDFMQAFGCCGYTDDILDYLVEEFGHRGLVEVGAGNGQWARALSDRYKAKNMQQSDDRSNWDFVLAYDTMEELPLSPQIYNSRTKPYQEYFYSQVRRCKSHEDVVKNFTSRGRVLLLVYPSLGSWPLETLKAYIGTTAGTTDAVNNTLVYVGEGRSGANCNDEFFDYLLNGGWKVEKILDVKASPGGKGFERLYVLTKVSM